MSVSSSPRTQAASAGVLQYQGLFWLAVAVAGAAVFFEEGIATLLAAWQLPEYSHGPLIPVLSLLLFLRQLKTVPIVPEPVTDRWVGVVVLMLALAMALIGKVADIGDVVAYALILWVASLLLVSFGWKHGKQFWPPVLHLIYMLPLPGLIYYKVSTQLQFVSSQMGVDMLRLLNVPVFLDGNIIDLGVYQLHVAEACSGLRYLFPILSFSYIFAVLYRGPMWHKAVLLLSAAPITIVMNSVRIAIAGVIVNVYGLDHVEGFSHFFEGWVIFLACVLLLFGLARILMLFLPQKMTLVEALDLETEGLGQQAMRLRLIHPGPALIASALIVAVSAAAWTLRPTPEPVIVDRDPFVLFPKTIDDWSSSRPRTLDPEVEAALGANDYHSVVFNAPEYDTSVELFMAWYKDQTKGGIHSPEVCLPGGGWEFASMERVDLAQELGRSEPFRVNRAVIQKGTALMLVYYWFQQQDRTIAWDYAAKAHLLRSAIEEGRTDGALVRLTTPIARDEPVEVAEQRLRALLVPMLERLPRYVPH